jgi:hypothetical protein
LECQARQWSGCAAVAAYYACGLRWEVGPQKVYGPNKLTNRVDNPPGCFISRFSIRSVGTSAWLGFESGFCNSIPRRN